MAALLQFRYFIAKNEMISKICLSTPRFLATYISKVGLLMCFQAPKYQTSALSLVKVKICCVIRWDANDAVIFKSVLLFADTSGNTKLFC